MTENLQAQLDLLPQYLGGHMLLTIVALAAGILICVPVAVLLTRTKRLQWPVLAIAGIMQTIPGIALLALMVPLLGKIGVMPALFALFIYSILPILRNTVTGINEVDASIIEAARGIGMTNREQLFRVELPLAMPVIAAGIRTSAVWVVGTATLSTPVGATSLGNYIFGGLQTQNYTSVLIGCVSAALLAIVLDSLIHVIEYALRNRFRKTGLTAALTLVLICILGVWPTVAKKVQSDRPRVLIGAKTFTEQYILGQLIVERLNRAGFDAEVASSMGSTILFEALAANEIDCYVDYSGTVWANYMKRDDLLNADTLLKEMSEWVENTRSVTCLGPLGFENTYALALPEPLADSIQAFTIEDIVPIARHLIIASDYSFFTRPEYKKLIDTYGLEFKDETTMDHSLMYPAVRERQVDIISAYSTDGWIVDFDLRVLKDSKQAFPPYDAVLLLSPRAAADEAIKSALLPMVNAISDELMRQANNMVDVKKGTIREAALFMDSGIEK